MDLLGYQVLFGTSILKPILWENKKKINLPYFILAIYILSTLMCIFVSVISRRAAKAPLLRENLGMGL